MTPEEVKKRYAEFNRAKAEVTDSLRAAGVRPASRVMESISALITHQFAFAEAAARCDENPVCRQKLLDFLCETRGLDDGGEDWS